jgi:hypothetical protein
MSARSWSCRKCDGFLVGSPLAITPVTPVSAPEMLCTPGPKNDTARMAVRVNDAPCAPSPSREKPMTPGCVLAAPQAAENRASRSPIASSVGAETSRVIGASPRSTRACLCPRRQRARRAPGQAEPRGAARIRRRSRAGGARRKSQDRALSAGRHARTGARRDNRSQGAGARKQCARGISSRRIRQVPFADLTATVVARKARRGARARWAKSYMEPQISACWGDGSARRRHAMHPT